MSGYQFQAADGKFFIARHDVAGLVAFKEMRSSGSFIQVPRAMSVESPAVYDPPKLNTNVYTDLLFFGRTDFASVEVYNGEEWDDEAP